MVLNIAVFADLGSTAKFNTRKNFPHWLSAKFNTRESFTSKVTKMKQSLDLLFINMA